MSDGVFLNMRGIEVVLDRLAREEDKVQNKVARKAGAAGARIVARKAKSNAPRQTGVLKRAIVGHVSRKRTKRNVVVTALVRVRSGKKESRRTTKSGKKLPSRDAFYAGWVEFGHKIVRRGERRRGIRERRGRSDKERVEPVEFLGPAYRDTQQQVLDEITRVATVEMNKQP